AFHPTSDTQDKKEGAGPNEGRDATLGAKHRKQKEQGRDQQKTHELFHSHHPRAGLGQKFEPGRLRAEQKIRRAHSQRDGAEHEQNDNRRLRKSEAQGGPKKWRSAWRSQYGSKDALKK